MPAVNCLLPVLLCLFLVACSENSEEEPAAEQPNVILIMVDDMGYECIGSYGSTYKTPVLDSLASRSIRFTNCISQPLCTPTRVKIMTGKRNYRNYDFFGHLNSSERTFGNVMQEAGYSTLITGKWQLNGLAYKDTLTHWSDATRPHQFGFDEYCLWQLTKTRSEGERFSHPLIEQNGAIVPVDDDSYGPDIFCEAALDFIERKREEPFFIYYPMVLVHEPFVPTPDSENWADVEARYEIDTAYFREMVTYTDKIVGRFLAKLEELNLSDNTLLLFTADNGTHNTIYTPTEQGIIRGGKGQPTDAGTKVPFIASWPAKMQGGQVFDGLIEFSDFFPTLAEIAGQEVPSDGKSFYALLAGEPYEERSSVFVHYDPRWGDYVNRFRSRFVRTKDYKLYHNGNFYYLPNDVLEHHPLPADSLTEEALTIRAQLQKELDAAPAWVEK